LIHKKVGIRKKKLGFGFVRLGELVGCYTVDLGYAEESELCIEILKLGQKVDL
jgi:hypothetical protein